jgi:hypothetical protein
MGYLATCSFCAAVAGWDGGGGGEGLADTLLETELEDETGGATPASRGLFGCRINQITTAAPTTMNRIGLMGRELCFGVCSGSVIDRLQCWCAELYPISGGQGKEPIRGHFSQSKHAHDIFSLG